MQHVRRLPFTLTFLAIMVLANTLAGTLSGVLPATALANWGISHRTVLDGQVFRLITGTFLSHDLGMFLRQLVFAAVIIGAYEWQSGTRRAVAMFVTIDISGSLIVLFGILPLLVHVTGTLDVATLMAHDVGMSAGGFGLIGALIAGRPRGWTYLAAVVFAILAKVWISFDPIADSAHLLCLLIGFGLQQSLDAREKH